MNLTRKIKRRVDAAEKHRCRLRWRMSRSQRAAIQGTALDALLALLDATRGRAEAFRMKG